MKRDAKTGVGDVKTFHVWMPDGRSLCDRRARRRHGYEPIHEMSEAEFQAYLDEQFVAPMCGSCLLIVERIRVQAAMLLRHSGRVHPSTFPESLAELRGTRWESQLRLGDPSFQIAPDKQFSFNRVADAIPEKILSTAVESFTDDQSHAREYLIELREAQTPRPKAKAAKGKAKGKGKGKSKNAGGKKDG